MNRNVEMDSFDDRDREDALSPLAGDEGSSAVDEDFDGMGDTVSPVSEVSPIGGEDTVAEGEDEVDPDEVKVIWDIVFPEGEEPLLVLALEDDPEISSAAVLSREDVDRLVALTRRVEKHYSVSSRFGRRVWDWVRRRKFFAAVTFAILAYIVISGIVTGF